MVEVVLLGELLLGRFEPAVDRLRGVGAAAAEALTEDRLVGRGDEDLDRVGPRGADLGGSLHLDLEDHRAALFEAAVELRVQRPVVVAGVGGELEEVFRRDPFLELLLGEEVIIAFVLLPLARLDTVNRIEISSNTALTSIAGLTATSINGDVLVRGNRALTSLGTMSSLTQITGNLTIDDNDAPDSP